MAAVVAMLIFVPVPLSSSTYLYQVMGTTNLVPNPGLESGASGWDNLGSEFTLDTTSADADTGTNSIKQISTSNFGDFHSSAAITVVPNAIYTLSVRAKIAVSSGSAPIIEVNNGGAYGSNVTALTLAASSGYTTFTKTFNTGSATSLYLRIKNNGGCRSTT